MEAGDASFLEVSVWDEKPPWCQPWTIVTTGVSGVAASWALFHTPFLTVPATGLVLLWWKVFLVDYPLMYAEYVRQERAGAAAGGRREEGG